MLVSILINNKYINLSLAVLYFIIIPYFNHNQTIFGRIITNKIIKDYMVQGFALNDERFLKCKKNMIKSILKDYLKELN